MLNNIMQTFTPAQSRAACIRDFRTSADAGYLRSRAAGMDKSGALPLARELSPLNLLKIINRSGGA